MKKTILFLSLCSGACFGDPDLQATTPQFPSSTITADPTNFTAGFKLEGDLPEDSDDVYLTVEYRPPGSSSFTFFDIAQISRATANLEEPVSYIFHINDGSGTYSFRAVVDAGGLIDESDEDNNVSSTISVTVP